MIAVTRGPPEYPRRLCQAGDPRESTVGIWSNIPSCLSRGNPEPLWKSFSHFWGVEGALFASMKSLFGLWVAVKNELIRVQRFIQSV